MCRLDHTLAVALAMNDAYFSPHGSCSIPTLLQMPLIPQRYTSAVHELAFVRAPLAAKYFSPSICDDVERFCEALGVVVVRLAPATPLASLPCVSPAIAVFVVDHLVRDILKDLPVLERVAEVALALRARFGLWRWRIRVRPRGLDRRISIQRA